jgi:hypothetical protein
MSSMVDHRSRACQPGLSLPRLSEGGAFVLLVRARFVLAGAVLLAGAAMGISGGVMNGPGEAPAASARGLRLDPNTVPPEVLTALPHVGASLVERWVKAREQRPFRSLDDARARVRGLGARTAEQIAPYFEFPESERQGAVRTTSRPAVKPRIARRQKSASANAEALRQPRLSASSAGSGQ